MSGLKNWKDGILYLLQRLGGGLSRGGRGFIRLFFPVWDAQQADKPAPAEKESSAFAGAGEQKEQKGQKKQEEAEKAGGLLPRNYLPLAGAYILAIALLMGVFISKLGKVPGLEVPGKIRMQNGAESGLPANDEGRAPGPTKNGGLEPDENKIVETGDGAGLEESETPETPPLEKDAAEGAGAPTAGLPSAGAPAAGTAGHEPAAPPQPQAASPLPAWQVSRPYGEYTSETLPSGGKLHTLGRGISLAATPGAPVAALWEGRVSKTGGGDSPYGQYVVLEHSGGYITFYGNLREVWVEKGGRVSRGEHLGLLPHYPPVEPGGTSQPSQSAVSAAAPAGAADIEGAPGRSGQKEKGGGKVAVPLKTIHKGIIGEADNSAWPFVAGNPLLYLEIRQGHSYLDPLSFIGAGVRN